MKKTIVFILFLGILLNAFSQQYERPKVAVVLCGGGAKGAAHVGALKVLEETGVPIDIVVGTSMGAIVGGLYAVGYSSDQMDSLLRSQNWEFLLSDQTHRLDRSFPKKEYSEKYVLSLPLAKKDKKIMTGGVVKGHNVLNLLSGLTLGYHDSIDFNTLPIPFSCVAEDIYTGEEVVFHSGNLPLAIRASMSIPGVFEPVSIGNHLLIDGGMCNNFPVDVARSMGADVVIGIDVQNDLKTKKEDFGNVATILTQLIDLSGKERFRDNVDDTDIYIKVNVDGYTTASFSKNAIDTLIARGKMAAEAKRDELIQLCENLNFNDSRPKKDLRLPDKFYVRNISFDGLDDRDKRLLLRRSEMNENDSVSVGQINHAVAIMRSVLDYASVNYQLVKNGEYNDLNFFLHERKEGSVNVGLRFDSEEIAAVAMNVTHKISRKFPMTISASGRLGLRTSVGVDCSVFPFVFTNINASYKFMYNDVKLYNHGERQSSYVYRCHFGDVNITNQMLNFKMKVALGVRYENFNYDDVVYNGKVYDSDKRAGYLSYYLHLFYDSFNKKSFPDKGSFCSAEYALVTQNGVKFNRLEPFSAVKAEWKTYIPLTNRFVVVPAVSARVLLADADIPFAYRNAMGGFQSGRYVNQQLPFVGIGAFEMMDDALLIPSVTLRQRLWQKHYVSLVGNVAFCDSKIFGLFDRTPEYGVSLGYGYDSFFGPIEAMFYYSDRSDKLRFYINIGLIF